MIHRGRLVSPGVAVGTAFVMDGRMQLEAAASTVSHDSPGIQLERLHAAVSRAAAQLQNLRRRLVAIGRRQDAPIFAAHAGLLADPSLHGRIENAIQQDGLSAEAAVARIVFEIEKQFQNSESSLLRDKATDIVDIGQRLVSCLRGRSELEFSEGSVIFADSLTPSELVRVARDGAAAIVTETCGAKSHTAILARGFGIPMITGIEAPTGIVATGESVLVDADNGLFIHEPTTEEQIVVDSRRKQLHDNPVESPPGKAISADGLPLSVLLNISDPIEADAVVRLEADGIGLYRTEFLYMNHTTWPTDAESLEAYQSVSATIGDRELCIRLADFGAEKCPVYADFAMNRNPSLGIRGVRLLLSRDDILKPQVRALAKIGEQRPLTVLLPMVDTIDTLAAITKRLCRHCSCRRREELPFQLGAMIEVPSAALLIEEFVRRVDSVSIGLNDLTQYLLAADRDDEMLERYHDALQPVVLRLLQSVIHTAAEHDTPLTMCGELAGNPALARLLIGLGARRFSVSRSHYGATVEQIRSLDTTKLRAIAGQAVELDSAKAVRQLLAD